MAPATTIPEIDNGKVLRRAADTQALNDDIKGSLYKSTPKIKPGSKKRDRVLLSIYMKNPIQIFDSNLIEGCTRNLIYDLIKGKSFPTIRGLTIVFLNFLFGEHFRIVKSPTISIFKA